MRRILDDIRAELGPMLRLGLPVVIGELGWMAMGVVDTVMVGGLGAESLGAVSVGRAVIMFVGVVGIGMVLGLDTLVSRAHGAGRPDECRRWLVQGLWLAALLAGPLMLAAFGLRAGVARWRMDPAVLPPTLEYIGAVAWTMPPLVIYAAARRYLQAINVVRPVMLALVSANLINVAANWVLIHGRLGAPPLGVAGSGWATVLSHAYLAATLLAVIVVRERRRGARPFAGIEPAPDAARIGRLVRLGSPAAGQMLLEVGVFAAATALASRLAPVALAAHQVALTTASVTFMVPLGVSSAAAVRVGHALGRGDAAGAGRAGWTALAVGGGFMGLAGLALVLLPETIVRLYIADPAVVAAGASLLTIAAVFQLFDGLQVVAIGALRGGGDTRTPLLFALVGYWGVALPLGWYLGFVADLGIEGLWIGLSAGLILAGLVLVTVWARHVAAWRRDGVTAGP